MGGDLGMQRELKVGGASESQHLLQREGTRVRVCVCEREMETGTARVGGRERKRERERERETERAREKERWRERKRERKRGRDRERAALVDWQRRVVMRGWTWGADSSTRAKERRFNHGTSSPLHVANQPIPLPSEYANMREQLSRFQDSCANPLTAGGTDSCVPDFTHTTSCAVSFQARRD